ncbi:MAG: hypothetical protein HF308_17160 [Ignavibacteria bacterium]|jgi:hypothetical protein|nr:hypothetical protein [Ignavibacteria bacterium]
MSKGTKQIRAGRIEDVIKMLEIRLIVFDDMHDKQLSDYGKGMVQGRVAEIDNVLEYLREIVE